MKMERFGNCSNENILGLVNKSKNINTKKATNNCMGVYLRWAGAYGKKTCIEKLPPESLKSSYINFMLKFIKNGQDYDYERNSLVIMQAGNFYHLDLFSRDKQYYFEKTGVVKIQIKVVACPRKKLKKFGNVINFVVIPLFCL